MYHSQRVSQVYLIDRPGLTQATVALGELGVTLMDPDHFALDVLNDILNSFGGKLFDEIRSREVRRHQTWQTVVFNYLWMRSMPYADMVMDCLIDTKATVLQQRQLCAPCPLSSLDSKNTPGASRAATQRLSVPNIASGCAIMCIVSISRIRPVTGSGILGVGRLELHADGPPGPVHGRWRDGGARRVPGSHPEGARGAHLW